MAQRGINKCIIVGNLGKDPEIRYTADGKTIASISVATSESWKDKQGQVQEKTDWHNISIFGKLAEIAGEYLRKGSQVYIEGKLKTRKWQDKQGQDRYTTEVVVDGFSGVMQMLGGRSGDAGGGAPMGGGMNAGGMAAAGGGMAASNMSQAAEAPQAPTQSTSLNDSFDDDIPF